MDEATAPTMRLQSQENSNNGIKRKRSLSAEGQSAPAPPTKAAKTHGSHLQINYLARQYSDTLPLIGIDDNLPSIVQLLGDYGGVLERHESLAGNLGARPLGPILIKRFERLFDGPPRVLKSHGKEGTTVSWLDVVEFARHKPEQFNLEKMRDGVRVCQFYTKQSRVEISEEDYVLISSGMPQKLIPPQPIAEDEEKELGTLEIMEKSITQVIQLADQVSARARQLKHRLTGRKNAIVSRREAEASGALEAARPSTTSGNENEQCDSSSPTSGFVAVNARPATSKESLSNGSSSLTNGKAYTASTASPSTRAKLMSYFNSQRERQNDFSTEHVSSGGSRSHGSKSKSKPVNDTIDYASILLNSASPVPIPNTPSNLVHYARPPPAERYDDSGPYKAEMLSRMDSMQRGDRVLPPCDRCRRLHMDCLKNLTACLGCTKKHAKCSWKEVTDQELIDNPHVPRVKDDPAAAAGGDTFASGAVAPLDGPPQPVRDEELLGEEEDSDDDKGTPAPAPRNGASHSHEPSTEQADFDTPEPGPGDSQIKRSDTPSKSLAPQAQMGQATDALEDVQAAAREILKKRRVEVLPDNVIGGFQSENRPQSVSTPEGSPAPQALREASSGAATSTSSRGDVPEKKSVSMERSRSSSITNHIDKLVNAAT